MTTKITLEAQLADDDLEALLHWIRAFDKSHSGCHFSIVSVSESNMSVEQVTEMLTRLGLHVLYAGRRQ